MWGLSQRRGLLLKMKVKDVIICDDCKKIVATEKCWMCDKDLCPREIVAGQYVGCLKGYTISFYNNIRIEIPVCYDCSNKIQGVVQDKENNDMLIELQKWIVEKVKRRLILNNLKEEKK